MTKNCLVCQSDGMIPHSVHDEIPYYKCRACGCISVDREVLIQDSRNAREYNPDYWLSEIPAARARSYGSTINRVAETILYSRIPIKSFVDIGTGPGFLLDAISGLSSKLGECFYGVEPFPPPSEARTNNKNYIVGRIKDLPFNISAGVCIEVIEHLFPDDLEQLLGELAKKCEEQAVFFFNSGQPEYVDNEDPSYLDPFVRGHVVSYSIRGAEEIFARHGFCVSKLPGRTWAFLAEYKPKIWATLSADQLMTRVWTAHPENISLLTSGGYGPMLHAIGIESARCYIESAQANQKSS